MTSERTKLESYAHALFEITRGEGLLGGVEDDMPVSWFHHGHHKSLPDFQYLPGKLTVVQRDMSARRHQAERRWRDRREHLRE